MKKAFEEPDLNDDEAAGFVERRAHLRYVTEQLSALQLGQRLTFVELLDLSGGGARCRVSTGFAPFVGDRVNLRLVDDTLRTGIVCRTEKQEFAIEFDQELPSAEDRVSYEYLGYRSYSDIIRLQKLIHGSG